MLVAVVFALSGCSSGGEGDTPPPVRETASEPARALETEATSSEETDMNAESETDSAANPATPTSETATFGAGCFWCVEAVLEQLDGVSDVRSGYMGGSVKNPTYEQVCSETTGHAEIVQVDFDPAKISYETLLDWFWRLHDPTTLNRQGADVGTRYRSAIFYHSDAQRKAAEASMTAAQNDFIDPIVTEVTEASPFYLAEKYHQDYYRQNKAQGYCRAVIRPKLKKLSLDE